MSDMLWVGEVNNTGTNRYCIPNSNKIQYCIYLITLKVMINHYVREMAVSNVLVQYT